MRVAIIFDDTVRPDTTGVYCRRALASLVDLEHFSSTNLDAVPRSGFDLYLVIDDGLRNLIPPDLRPVAWWAIDTHIDPDGWYQLMAQQCDFVFTAQRDGVEYLRESVRTQPLWLPLACDPASHCQLDVPKSIDLAFVGNPIGEERNRLLQSIQRNLPNVWVGRAFSEEMARIYSSARLIFNRSVCNDVNMRVFEALACGSMLLTNALPKNGQPELFRDGVHLDTYRDSDELHDKIRYYLKHAETRERIAAAGRQEVLAKHTYSHRMQTILDVVSQRQESEPLQVTVPRFPPSTTNSATDSLAAVVADLIPPGARRLLHLDASDGALAVELNRRREAQASTVENPEKDPANADRQFERMVIGRTQELDPTFIEGASWDCIICDNALGQARHPRELLARLKDLLAPGGSLIVRAPNLGHRSTIQSLLAGNLTYGLAHALKDEPLHPLMRRDLEKLLAETGYQVEEVRMLESVLLTAISRLGTGNELDGPLDVGDTVRPTSQDIDAHELLLIAVPQSVELAAAPQTIPSKHELVTAP